MDECSLKLDISCKFLFQRNSFLYFKFQLILDSKKRVFSWGFGGYGRLGHSDPKDVMVPQSIQFFAGPNRGAQMIAAGSTYSMAVSEHGTVDLPSFHASLSAHLP